MPLDRQQIERFRQQFTEFGALDFERLYVADAGSLSLTNELRLIIDSISDKINKANAVVNCLPPDVLEKLNNALHSLIHYTTRLATLSEHDVVARKGEIVNEFQNNEDLLHLIWPSIASVYSDKVLSEGGALEDQAKKEAGEIQRIRESLKQELHEFKESYREKFSRNLLLKQEEIFFKTAHTNRYEAWFRLSGIIAIFCILFWILTRFIIFCWFDVSCMFLQYNVTQDNQNFSSSLFYYELIIKKSFLRLFVLILIVYLLKFAVKNYNALRHNFIINTHKANSLAAGLMIFDRINKDKNTVLTLASQAIFEQHKTGYLSKEEVITMSFLEKLTKLIKT